MSTTEQRVAVVTGAARGIGAATAVRLAAEGRALAVIDLDEAACKDTVEKITAAAWARPSRSAQTSPTRPRSRQRSPASPRSSERRRSWSTTRACCATTCCSR